MSSLSQHAIDLLNDIGFDESFINSYQSEIDEISIDSGQELFKPGDACNLFLILLSGSIRVELTSRKGR